MKCKSYRERANAENFTCETLK